MKINKLPISKLDPEDIMGYPTFTGKVEETIPTPIRASIGPVRPISQETLSILDQAKGPIIDAMVAKLEFKRKIEEL